MSVMLISVTGEPETQKHVKEKLKQWCIEHPDIDVVRFTTFFHQFTLTFDEQPEKTLSSNQPAKV